MTSLSANNLDKPLIHLADELVSQERDGRISLSDAEAINQHVSELGDIDEVILQSLHFLLDNYRWTQDAQRWFQDNLPQPKSSSPLPSGSSVKQITNLLHLVQSQMQPNKTLVIHDNTFAAIDASHRIPQLIKIAFEGGYITLKEAKVIKDSPDEVIIKGKGGFALTEANRTVTMVLQLTEGNIQAIMLVDLPDGWKFTDTFPDLPTLIDFNDLTKEPSSPLDHLSLSNPQFLLSTHTGNFKYQDREFQLQEGINFFADMQCDGMLGIFQNSVQSKYPSLRLGGTICIDEDAPIPNKSTMNYPWEHVVPIPSGINLSADISGVDFGMKPMDFAVEKFRIYSPLSLEKWDSAAGFLPMSAFTGNFKIPSIKAADGTKTAQVSTALELPFGSGEAILAADFSESALGSLSDLTQVTGVDLQTLLPKALADKVGKLGIQDIAITLNYLDKVHISRLKITIGMPELQWAVWQDVLSVDSIICTFDILNPLVSASRAFNVILKGQITIEGVPIDIVAQKVGDYQLSAALVQGAHIPLGSFMKTYAGDIPVVDRLSIDSLYLSLVPHQTYSMYMDLNEGTNALTIPVGHTELKLSDIDFDLNYATKGGVTGSFSATTIIAGLDCTITLDKLTGGWQFTGDAAQDKGIQLTTLLSNTLSTFGISMQHVKGGLPDVAAKNIEIQYSTLSGDFDLSGELDEKIPFEIGNHKPELDTQFDLSARKNELGKHIVAGRLRSKLEIASCEFDVSLSLGDSEQYVRAEFHSEKGIAIEDIILTLGGYFGLDKSAIQTVVPDVGAKLQDILFEYNITQKRFTFSAQSNYGDVFLVIEKLSGASSSSSWGIVVGIEITMEELNKVEGLHGTLKEIKDSVSELGLEQVFLIGSNENRKEFQIPELPDLKRLGTVTEQPDATTGSQVPAVTDSSSGMHQVVLSKNPTLTSQVPTVIGSKKPSIFDASLKLEKGLTVGAVLEHDSQSKPSPMGKMFGLLHTSAVVIQAFIGKDGFEIFGRVEDVIIPLSSGSAIKLSAVSIDIKLGDEGLEFGLMGSILMTIDKTLLTVIGRLEINLEELVMSIEVDETKGPGLPGPLPGIHFDRIAFELGVYFEPPGVGLGLMGGFHIGQVQQPNSNTFAFVLEIIEEVPNPLYMAFAAEELDLATAVTAFTDKPASDKIQSISQYVNGTDISFHWADSVVILPDGTTAQPGLGFKGIVNIFGFDAYANFQSGINGITADAEMDPLHIKGVVSITGDGKGFSLDCIQDENHDFIPVNYNQQLNRVHDDSGKALPIPVKHQFIKPGGAVFHLSTNASPYLHASINIRLFDTIGESLTATIDDNGFSFDLVCHISDTAHIELQCTLDKHHGFKAMADFELHYNGEIGPIIPDIDATKFELDVDIQAYINLTVTPEEFKAEIKGHFYFEGTKFDIPDLHLDEPFSSLKKLPSLIFKQLEDNAEEIFKDLFDEFKKLGEEIEKGAKEIEEDGKKAADAIAKEATAEYNNIKSEAKKTVTSLVQDTKNLEKEAGKVADDVKNIAADAENKAKEIADKAEQTVSEIGDQVTTVTKEATKEVENIAKASEQELKSISDQISTVEKDAEAEVEKLGQEASQEAGVILSDAQQEAEHVLNDAKVAVDAINAEAQKLWDEADQWAYKLTQKLAELEKKAEELAKSAYHSVSHFAGKAFHSISHFFHL